MSKARDLANAGTALTTVSATELGYLDGVTSAVQTQINSKEATLPSQTGNTGKYLTTDGTDKSWAAVTTLPSQTGNSGKYLTTDGSTASWGAVGTTWTPRYGNPSVTAYSGAYNGSLYIITAGAGTIFTSTDAITWTSRSTGFGTDAVYSVAWSANLSLWIIVGDNGKLATSPDGITWTLRTSNMGTNAINHVIVQGSTIIAVGRGGGTTNTGGIIYSTDGTTWTRKSQSLTVGDAYRGVVWNGTYFIVFSSTSTNNILYATTPSGTWTAAQAGLNSALDNIVWDGTRHIIFTANGSVYYSTSTTCASAVQFENFNVVSGGEGTGKSLSYYYNGRIYCSNNPWLFNMSTVPTQTYYLFNQAAKQYAPGSTSDNPSARYLYIGSQGIILVSAGIIWTSF